MDKYQEGARILIKLLEVENATIILPIKKCYFVELMEPFANLFSQSVKTGFFKIDIEERSDIVDPYIIVGGKIYLLEDFLK